MPARTRSVSTRRRSSGFRASGWAGGAHSGQQSQRVLAPLGGVRQPRPCWGSVAQGQPVDEARLRVLRVTGEAADGPGERGIQGVEPLPRRQLLGVAQPSREPAREGEVRPRGQSGPQWATSACAMPHRRRTSVSSTAGPTSSTGGSPRASDDLLQHRRPASSRAGSGGRPPMTGGRAMPRPDISSAASDSMISAVTRTGGRRWGRGQAPGQGRGAGMAGDGRRTQPRPRAPRPRAPRPPAPPSTHRRGRPPGATDRPGEHGARCPRPSPSRAARRSCSALCRSDSLLRAAARSSKADVCRRRHSASAAAARSSNSVFDISLTPSPTFSVGGTYAMSVPSGAPRWSIIPQFRTIFRASSVSRRAASSVPGGQRAQIRRHRDARDAAGRRAMVSIQRRRCGSSSMSRPGQR